MGKKEKIIYRFEGEMGKKYDVKTFQLFSEIFQVIPLAHCLNGKVLCLHGGLFSKDGVKLEDIRKVDRKKEPGDEGIMCECMWSDPCDQDGRHPSKRGVGVMFGPDVAARFCEDNDLDLVVRSHEVKQEGYEIQKGGKVITVFSAPNYCDQMGNKGALIRFKGSEMKPVFKTFEKVPHPNVPVMAYASPWSLF
jgi:serine/threonine-protein phosphatase 5